jgi:hypothetical protein
MVFVNGRIETSNGFGRYVLDGYRWCSEPIAWISMVLLVVGFYSTLQMKIPI